MSDPPRRVVIGVGNPDRGDDGVGRVVARLLRGRLPDDVRIEERNGEAADLIDLLRYANYAILIDAASSGAPPGSVTQLDCSAGDTPPLAAGASSHGFGLAHAIELARVLGYLPPCCLIYAIETTGFDIGSGVSPQVLDAARHVARAIQSRLGRG